MKIYFHLTVFAKDLKGWHNLMGLVSECHKTGFYGRACADLELLERYHEGLVCMTGCLGGMLSKSINKGDDRGAQAWIRQLKRIFGDDLFVEIMPHDIDEQRVANIEAVRIAGEHGLAVVTTLDEHYPTVEWANTQDILLMIATNQTVKKREKRRDEGEDIYEFSVKTFYHQTRDEILAHYMKFHPGLSMQVVEESLANTMVAASRALPFQVDAREKMPVVSFPDVVDNAKYLRQLVFEGLASRGYGDDPEYIKDIDFELATIEEHGVVDYILMVWQIVEWSRSTKPVPRRKGSKLVYDGPDKKPIMVGPGRGSAAGSKVSWCLRITSVNPKKHNMLFERFLNPNRKGLPDIDLDFPPDRVDEVEDFVKSVYGKDRVVDIIAHSTFGPRAALTDAGRVLSIPYDHVRAVTKTIDDKERAPLDKILAVNPALQRYAIDHFEAYNQAKMLQDQVARKSEHAGGLLILPDTASKYIPVERQGGMKGKLLSAFGERSGKGNALISDYGYIKVDILRIAELTKQAYAVDLIEQRTGERIDLDALPVHDDPYAVDPAVMDVFKQGLYVALFQWTGVAQKLTRQIGPDNLFDLAAINALIRPGPRGAGIDQAYARRKNGLEDAVAWHEVLNPYLSHTQNLMVFQEQLVQVVHALGGLTLAEADIFRKIASKLYRDPEYARETMGVWYEPIRSGFMKNGISAEDFGEPTRDDRPPTGIWKEFLSFSDYSFNLCFSGDTIIERAGAGRFCSDPKITIKELWDIQEGPRTAMRNKLRSTGIKILQMDADGRIRPRKMKKIHYNGRAQVLKVVTFGGRKIKVTANHRLLTNDGYLEAAQLLGKMLVVEGEREPYGDQYLNGRGRGHVLGGSYEGQGFQDGESNPGWLDGRTALLLESKQVVRARTSCESCGIERSDQDGPHAFEAGHVKTLEQCGGDYLAFHAVDNMMLFCNGCHKRLDYEKGERKARWTHGRPTELDLVVSIDSCGVEDVFDVEMDTEEHNLVANGIVSHNSHADAYALLAYRDAYLKRYYARELYASFLSKGLSQITKKKAVQKQDTAREVRHVGLKIMPPDVNESGSDYTVVHDGIRFGLQSIRGIGPAGAAAIEEHRPFDGFADFEKRVPARAVNVTARAALVMSGAFDRWRMRDGFTEDRIDEMERELLGMSLTSIYSIAQYASVIDGRFWTEDEVDAAQDGTMISIAGEVTNVKEHIDSKSNMMAFVDLAYGPNVYNCTIFSYLYAEYADLLRSRRPILITGEKSTYKDKASIKVKTLPCGPDEEPTPPIMDFQDYVNMVGNEAEELAQDSVFPEDLQASLDEPLDSAGALMQASS